MKLPVLADQKLQIKKDTQKQAGKKDSTRSMKAFKLHYWLCKRMEGCGGLSVHILIIPPLIPCYPKPHHSFVTSGNGAP